MNAEEPVHSADSAARAQEVTAVGKSLTVGRGRTVRPGGDF